MVTLKPVLPSSGVMGDMNEVRRWVAVSEGPSRGF